MRKYLSVLLTFYFCLISVTATEIQSKSQQYFKDGKAHFLSEQYREAISSLILAINTLDTGDESFIEELKYRAYLANAYWNNCNDNKAGEQISICEAGIKKCRSQSDPALLEVYMQMAEYYLYLDHSFETSDRCIELTAGIISKYFPDVAEYSAILYNLKGYSDYLKKDYENALYYFERSLSLLKNVPSLVRYEGTNHAYIISIKVILRKDNRKIIEYGQKMLKRSDFLPETQAILYFQLGLTYRNMKDTLNAQKYFHEAIQRTISNKTNINYNILVRSYNQLSLFSKDDRDKRLFYLDKALKAALQVSPTDKDVIFIDNAIAKVYYAENNYGKTLEFLQRALIAGSSGFSDTAFLSNPQIDQIRQYQTMVDVLSLKGLAIARLNTNDKNYAKCALQCVELADQMLNKRLSNVEVENSGLRLANQRWIILNEAVSFSNYVYRYTGEEIYAEKAFYNSEKGKAQLLKFYSEKPEILKKAGVPDHIIQRSIEIGNEILDIENRIVLNKNKSSQQEERLTYLYDQRDLLNYEISQNYPEYQRIRYNLSVPTVNEVRSRLEPDQALIEYEIWPSFLLTFVITKEEFYQYGQPITNKTIEKIELMRKLISVSPSYSYTDSSFTQFCETSFDLYKFLIQPVYNKIRGKRLIIVPHGPLSMIPFEALITQKNEGNKYKDLQWLFEEFPIIYAFSASLLFDEKRNSYGKYTAAFVPEYESDSLSKLEGTFEEARYLNKISNCKIFKGKKADEWNFKKEASAYRVLHIASHTESNDTNPDLSSFLMHRTKEGNEDGRLYAFEIKQMKLNAQLAVLSGCNTGYGPLRLSEGFLSLARSFLFTGIRTVAFTLWPVADKSSKDIMKGFYSEMNKGQPLDIAMMRSKIDFMKKADPVKAHPYYWAGFIVAGKAQKIPHENYQARSFFLIIILLTAGTAYIAFRDHRRRRSRRSEAFSE